MKKSNRPLSDICRLIDIPCLTDMSLVDVLSYFSSDRMRWHKQKNVRRRLAEIENTLEKAGTTPFAYIHYLSMQYTLAVVKKAGLIKSSSTLQRFLEEREALAEEAGTVVRNQCSKVRLYCKQGFDIPAVLDMADFELNAAVCLEFVLSSSFENKEEKDRLLQRYLSEAVLLVYGNPEYRKHLPLLDRALKNYEKERRAGL